MQPDTQTNQNNSSYFRHNHDGVNSELLYNTPQSALTAANSGGLSSVDATIIANIRTRLNELETKLKAIGLIL